MTISAIELIYSLNKAYRLVQPRRKDLDTFKNNLLLLLGRLDESESEENLKIHLMDFLKNTFYHPEHWWQQKGRQIL